MTVSQLAQHRTMTLKQLNGIYYLQMHFFYCQMSKFPILKKVVVVMFWCHSMAPSHIIWSSYDMDKYCQIIIILALWSWYHDALMIMKWNCLGAWVVVVIFNKCFKCCLGRTCYTYFLLLALSTWWKWWDGEMYYCILIDNNHCILVIYISHLWMVA